MAKSKRLQVDFRCCWRTAEACHIALEDREEMAKLIVCLREWYEKFQLVIRADKKDGIVRNKKGKITKSQGGLF